MSLYYPTRLWHVAPPLEEWIRDYATRVLYDILITAGMRSVEQVNANAMRGTSNATRLWETAHGPRRWNNMVVACAIDVLVQIKGIIMKQDCQEYVDLDADAKAQGFVTGRDWTSPKAQALGDFGHIELANWKNLPYAGSWVQDSNFDFSDVEGGSSSCSL